MKRLFGKKKSNAGSQDVALNIAAMADIFTVLLVFLLKSFSTGSINLTPAAGLVLPQAQAQVPNFEALKIEVAPTAILVEDNPVLKFKDFNLPQGEIQKNRVIKSLSGSLEKERKRQLLIANANSNVKIDAKVLIVADQKTPYSLLKSVLASAAIQGYTDFKLAVIKAEGSP